MYHRISLPLIGFASLCLAGPNSSARLHVDMRPATDAIVSEAPCRPDSTIATSVQITGASRLFSYSFYVNFDTSRAAFVSGRRGDDNFLERNDGSASFSARISRNDSSRILVGNFLSGDDESHCVSGDGFLCLLTFRLKKADTVSLTIDSALLIGCNLEEDRPERYFAGKIIPSDGSRVTYARRHPAFGPTVTYRKNEIAITFDRATPYSLTAVNPLGKQLFSKTDCAETVIVARGNNGRSGSSQMMLLRVNYAGNELVIPVLR